MANGRSWKQSNPSWEHDQLDSATWGSSVAGCGPWTDPNNLDNSDTCTWRGQNSRRAQSFGRGRRFNITWPASRGWSHEYRQSVRSHYLEWNQTGNFTGIHGNFDSNLDRFGNYQYGQDGRRNNERKYGLWDGEGEHLLERDNYEYRRYHHECDSPGRKRGHSRRPSQYTQSFSKLQSKPVPSVKTGPRGKPSNFQFSEDISDTQTTMKYGKSSEKDSGFTTVNDKEKPPILKMVQEGYMCNESRIKDGEHSENSSTLLSNSRKQRPVSADLKETKYCEIQSNTKTPESNEKETLFTVVTVKQDHFSPPPAVKAQKDISPISTVQGVGRYNSLRNTPFQINKTVNAVTAVIPVKTVEGEQASLARAEHTRDGGEHTMEGGKHTMEEGEHGVEGGKHIVEGGEHSIEVGKHRVEVGKYTVAGDEGMVEVGEHTVKKEKHKVEGDEQTVERGKHTVDKSPVPIRSLFNDVKLKTECKEYSPGTQNTSECNIVEENAEVSIHTCALEKQNVIKELICKNKEINNADSQEIVQSHVVKSPSRTLESDDRTEELVEMKSSSKGSDIEDIEQYLDIDQFNFVNVEDSEVIGLGEEETELNLSDISMPCSLVDNLDKEGQTFKEKNDNWNQSNESYCQDVDTHENPEVFIETLEKSCDLDKFKSGEVDVSVHFSEGNLDNLFEKACNVKDKHFPERVSDSRIGSKTEEFRKVAVGKEIAEEEFSMEIDKGANQGPMNCEKEPEVSSQENSIKENFDENKDGNENLDHERDYQKDRENDEDKILSTDDDMAANKNIAETVESFNIGNPSKENLTGKHDKGSECKTSVDESGSQEKKILHVCTITDTTASKINTGEPLIVEGGAEAVDGLDMANSNMDASDAELITRHKIRPCFVNLGTDINKENKHSQGLMDSMSERQPCLEEDDQTVGEEENSNKTDDGEHDVDDRGKDIAYVSSPVSFLDGSDSDEDLPTTFMHTGDDIHGQSSATKGDAASSSSIQFTLDGLLADHEEKADLVREMDDINRELQDELKQGGFVNILNKHDSSYTESEINDEQRNILRHFEIQETQIRDDRPGVQVFKPQNYCQVFNSALHPTQCGFTAGSNGLSLEKHIQSVVPAQYKLLITSGIITQCFTKITCQSQLLRWIYFIMSVHSDQQVQEGCKKVLLEILHYQNKYSAQKWTPRLSDLLSVFVNYGASLESLVNCSSNTIEIIRSKLLYLQGYNSPVDLQAAGYKIENLILVLQILSQALQGQSMRYSPTDLNLLCAVLCKASLDTNIKHGCAVQHFQNCIAMAFKHYTELDWSKERLKLTRMLVNVATHHHDRAHIAQLLPPGVRGSYVQRRYCYLVLNDILLTDTEITDDELEALEIKDIEPFVCHIRDLLENDAYKLSSVITLMDLCVGVNLTLKSAQREQLKTLLEQVRRVRVKDNVSFLDRTRVKDSIVRMTSKWALDIQTMKGKQTKIFEYASPVKMRIETISTVQTEDDDESDQESASKMMKVTPPEQT